MIGCMLGMLIAGQEAGGWVYVTPGVPLEVRDSASPSGEVIWMFEAGAQLNDVRSMPELGYTQVILSSGEAGWVMSDRLSFREPDQNSMDESSMAQPDRAPDQLQLDIAATQTELNVIRQALLSSTRMDEERQHLRETIERLEAEQARAQARWYATNGDQKQFWFALGAATGVLGLLLGLLSHHTRFLERYRG